MTCLVFSSCSQIGPSLSAQPRKLMAQISELWNFRHLETCILFSKLQVMLLFILRYTYNIDYCLGLGSIGKTSSARESLTINTHHLLTSSNELDTLPPNPTSFEPLPNSLVPPKKYTRAYLVLLFLKKYVALRRLPLILHCDRHYRER